MLVYIFISKLNVISVEFPRYFQMLVKEILVES